MIHYNTCSTFIMSDSACGLQTPEVKKDDSAFFERLGQEVESEMKRGKPEGERKISESLMVGTPAIISQG